MEGKIEINNLCRFNYFYIYGFSAFAGQSIKIQNHSFGVITEGDGDHADGECSKVATFINSTF